MKLNQVPNLRVEDFPGEQQTWLSKLFIQLNPFIQSVNQLFSQNIDYSNNIRAISTSYDITTFQPFSFLWPFTDMDPFSVTVGKAQKGTLLSATLLMAPWSFDSSTRLININSVLEITTLGVQPLTAGTRYKFTMRATV